MVGSDPFFTVSEAVAVMNQSLEMIYPTMTIVGELANFKVAKGRWVYADLKDDIAKIRCFGTIYALPGPLEDGMMLEIIGEPRLHPQFGFNLNIRSIRPVGEGSIKKAANLLQDKLEKEGLFSVERKRPIPYAPTRVGLIASEQSAAYADFIKILDSRWQGVEVELFNVTVQGESAPETLIQAFQYFNQQSNPVEVLIMIRGGGSADDLSAFNAEQVTRSVAGSRIPTVVAIGHEVDVSLSELAADLRASTPSNAAEILFPDRVEFAKRLILNQTALIEMTDKYFDLKLAQINQTKTSLLHKIESAIQAKESQFKSYVTLLESIHPKTVLSRGYALVEVNGHLVSSVSSLSMGTNVKLTLKDGSAKAKISEVKK